MKLRWWHAAVLVLAAALISVFALRAEKNSPGITRKLLSAAAAPPEVFNPNWKLPILFVDNANVTGCASDGNDCTHSSCAGAGQGPCLTAHYVNDSKWGCGGSPKGWPRLQQVTVLSFMSTDTEAPLYFFPAIENGGALLLTANLPAATHTGGVTSVTARTRTSDGSGVPVITDSGASPGDYPPGALLRISAGSGNMWVHAQPTGTTVVPTQPLAATVAPTTVVSPAETVISPGATTLVNATLVGAPIAAVESVIGSGSDAASPQSAQVFVYHIDVTDTNGIGADGVRWGGGVIGYESKIDRVVNVTDSAGTLDSGCVNCWLSAGIVGARPSGALFRLNGGTHASTATQCNPAGGAFAFDGDFWLDASCTLPGGAGIGFLNLSSPGVTLSLAGDSYLLPIASG